MNIQDTINAYLASARKDTLATSPQLTLGELLLKVEHLIGEHAQKLVRYDFGETYPVSFDSWRGAYEEVALDWNDGQPVLSLDEFYTLISKTIGAEFTGYKGGDYIMNKHTPIWVSNYGEADNRGVIDLIAADNFIIIITNECQY